MIKISVIIPVYNDRLNISECLDSILDKQDMEEKEIICIDDGSTDGSGQILEQYQRKYPNFVLLRQEHAGLSAARNLGLKAARGKYVYFADSDDIVEENMLNYVWNICEKNVLDVLFFSFDSFGDSEEMNIKYGRHIFEVKRKHNYDYEIISGVQLHKKFWENGEYYPMVWLQIVRRDFLIKNRIQYSENLIYEDNLYTFYVLLKAKKALCINEIFYHKRIRENSITTNPESVISVYSFLYTYIQMLHTFEACVQADDIYGATRRVGKIQTSFRQMIEDIQTQLVKRYRRLTEEKKQILLQKCNFYEKDILEMAGKSVSVIIPMYNTKLFIGECIRSVQAQTIQNIEIIIVDDGSTDGSSELVREMQKSDKRIQYYYQQNSGSGVARNKGMEYAKGDYLAFLDSDDLYFEEDALEKMVFACMKHDTFICGSYRVELKHGKLIQTDFLRMFGEIPEEGMCIDFVDYQKDFFYQSFLYDREFIQKNKIFFPPYRRYQDPPFLLKAMDTASKFCVIPKILHCYRKGHQDYAGNGKHVKFSLCGIRDNLLLSENKYDELFEKSIDRIEGMFGKDIREHWSPEVKKILEEINEIYKRKYPESGDIEIMKKLVLWGLADDGVVLSQSM